MPKQMTEAAAWRKLAEWYATGTGWICWNTGEWSGVRNYDYDCGPIPFSAPWRIMYSRVSAHSEMGKEWIPVTHGLAHHSEQNSDTRVIFCLLMALECQEEGN